MSRLRILVLAADANPESISLALEGYSHSAALAQHHDVTLVVRSRNEEVLRRAPAPFHAIESVRMSWVDRFHDWCIRWIFRNNFHSRALTPFVYPFCLAFEWYAWRQLRTKIRAGEFDVVLRILPANPVLPSVFPFLLRNVSLPFVAGPINGGLPWPPGFSQSDNQKSWIDSLRNVYRFLPFARSTYRRAAAIIAGSSQTFAEFSIYSDKLFFVAENGVDRSVCLDGTRRSDPARKLELMFLGALVPYKACDLALRGAAPLLQRHAARLTIVGDGPERKRLEELTKSLGIEESVSFCGMLPHAEAMQRLRSADVMVYPSVREFGGAVVVEALASGAVPIVADFGGPGDIVQAGIGYKIPLTSENDVVEHIEKALTELAHDRDLLEHIRQQGMSYARERLTWDAKAQDTAKVLNWAVQRGPKPDFLPPNRSPGRPEPAPQVSAEYAGSAGPILNRTFLRRNS
jgi:glycosyltransferase involved in cell wall biosynthesis